MGTRRRQKPKPRKREAKPVVNELFNSGKDVCLIAGKVRWADRQELVAHIRDQDKLGVTAPYYCAWCGGHHQTSKDRTVQHFMKRMMASE